MLARDTGAKDLVNPCQFEFPDVVAWGGIQIIYMGLFQRDNLFLMFSLNRIKY